MTTVLTPDVEAKWVSFEFIGPSASGKTNIWLVLNGGDNLGSIRWFGRWRRYAFHPAPDTIFEKDCLRDIAQFCEEVTDLHRQARKERV